MAKKKPYRYPLYLLVRFLAGCFDLVPRGVALGAARFLGSLGFCLVPRQRKATVKHLTQAYGESKTPKEINEIAKGVFQNLLQTAVDILQNKKFAKKDIKEFVDVGNAYEIYRDLLKEGKGLLSITAHMGNWELLAGTFGREGFEGAVVARRVYYEPYNQWIVGLRQALNVRTIYREDAAREISRVLRKNQIVGLLPDQDVHSLRGVFVPFFGRLAYTPVAPVRIALSTGAPIVVNFLVRSPKNRYKLVVGKVIRPSVEENREDAVKKYTAEWMSEFEKMIREYPDQWAWMHNRWETQPETVDPQFKQRELTSS